MQVPKQTVVLGLGEIGKPLFNLISKAERGATIGVDIQPVEAPSEIGIMHVCYPFQLPKGFIQTTHDYATKYKPEIIVVNSTVTPGTTAEIAKVTGVPSVYSPVRGKHTRLEAEFLQYQKFLAGTTRDAAACVNDHFNSVGMKTTIVSSTEGLELAKLLETTYFGLLITWAQEMDRFAKQTGSGYLEVTQFFTEVLYLPPVVFQPGFIGGHCVMSNIELLKTRFDSEFLTVIKNSNDRKAQEIKTGEELKLRIEPIMVRL